MNEFDLHTQIDLLRHGECEGGQIFRGKTDVRLSEVGQAKMQKVCFSIDPGWDVIVSSPLKRCALFAEQISQDLGIPCEVDERLQEISFGDWDGQEIERVMDRYQEELTTWRHDPTSYTPPNGEPIRQFALRISEVYDHLLTSHQGKKILLIAHGGVIRMLISQVLAMPLSTVNRIDMPYAGVSRVAVYHLEHEDVTKLLAHNFFPHS